MSKRQYSTALIVGAGAGISASLARLLAERGLKIALAARNVDKLTALCTEIGGQAFQVDASGPGQVDQLFEDVALKMGEPDVVIYNASGRVRGSLIDLDPTEVEHMLLVSAFGGFLVGQAAAWRFMAKPMEERGAILFTGASASIKGYARSAPFAMGKFALRGLAQSMARELAPQGIHVAHFVIDGAVRSTSRVDPPDKPDSTLDPDAIAETYWQVLQQPRSAWTWEVELRPWVESF
ncbi:MAG: SDR family NAD(P)-dependent oxidoreductase [Pseudomonadota bacterium]